MKHTTTLIIAVLLLAMPTAYAVSYPSSPLWETNRCTSVSPYARVEMPFEYEYSAKQTALPTTSVGGFRCSTIYAPFSNELPSAYAEQAVPGLQRRRAFGGEGMGSSKDDDPNRSNLSPIGEAWILLLLAAGWGLLTMRRKKKLNIQQDKQDRV